MAESRSDRPWISKPRARGPAGGREREGAGGRGGQARCVRPSGARPISAAISSAFASPQRRRRSPSARTLLDKVIAAKGGLETLRAVKSITAVTTAELSTPDGPVRAETTTYLEYPNRVRVETKLPEATLVQGFDGKRAWVQDPNGTHDVPGADGSRARSGLQARHDRRAARGARRGPSGRACCRTSRTRPASCTTRSSCRRSISSRWCLRRSRHESRHQADLRRRRTGTAARRRAVLRLSAGRRRADRLHGQDSARRPAGARAAASPTSRSTRRSIPRCSNAPRLERAPPAVVRRAVRRSLRRRADARAARARSGHRRLPASAGPEFAAAGGELIADYRGLSVTGLTEALAKVPRSFRLLRTLVKWARDERPDALVVDRLSRFQLSAGAPRSRSSACRSSTTSARRSGRGAPAG